MHLRELSYIIELAYWKITDIEKIIPKLYGTLQKCILISIKMHRKNFLIICAVHKRYTLVLANK